MFFLGGMDSDESERIGVELRGIIAVLCTFERESRLVINSFLDLK